MSQQGSLFIQGEEFYYLAEGAPEAPILLFQEASAVIPSGPYRFTRNPIYLSMASLLLGAAVFAGSLSPFVVVPAFILIIEKLFISTEEAMLAQRFPAEYAAYSARVRRWL